jgi:predicted flap endonuclease-1-like 5' DNA nuclease
MASLAMIEGIGETYSQKLSEAGIRSTGCLLERGSSRRGRREITEKTGLRTAQVVRWVNQADLFRIKGVGEEFADLLEAAAVDTVPELVQRNAGNLHQKLIETNEEKRLIRCLPTFAQVEGWVDQARQIPRRIRY